MSHCTSLSANTRDARILAEINHQILKKGLKLLCQAPQYKSIGIGEVEKKKLAAGRY